ncbi:uncharacterized protein LOC116026943 [Ipomoea triloba]|uniref:uncharacterized protein LOC116026943 n=1 Tax=Ipomoea triloba TaxID=35885 RepID=UPI00125D80FE|nr:uncharacterized protein LOC116026943 [Ipomoea triloba]
MGEFMGSSTNTLNGDVVDEINMYYDCRYISTCEGTWRLLDMLLSDSDKKQFALVELEKLLSLWGKCLRDFLEMPLPDETSMGLMENMLLAEELAYDKESLKTKHETLVTQLTDEQKNVYNSVMNDIDCNGGGLIFVYGYK